MNTRNFTTCQLPNQKGVSANSRLPITTQIEKQWCITQFSRDNTTGFVQFNTGFYWFVTVNNLNEPLRHLKYISDENESIRYAVSSEFKPKRDDGHLRGPYKPKPIPLIPPPKDNNRPNNNNKNNRPNDNNIPTSTTTSNTLTTTIPSTSTTSILTTRTKSTTTFTFPDIPSHTTIDDASTTTTTTTTIPSKTTTNTNTITIYS
ncbi:hypothetical protein F8M41_005407 [Gigaspora margarita]|uniref:Uncharacterized protein n=1 Tax=Gigaspora margarita TaxID=4874 RepID=A0A8H3X8Y2_GIGMA|nr:hypothetical protein F8M41_005407 [Gigaspora margarita]